MSVHRTLLSPRVEFGPGMGFGSHPGPRCARWTATLVAFALLSLPAALADAIEVPPFTSVSVKGAVEVAFERGEKHRVVIASGHGVLTRVDSGELRIEGAEGEQAQVTVTLPELQQLRTDGAIHAVVRYTTGESFKVISLGTLTLEAKGSVKRLELELTGVASIELGGLQSDVTEIQARGSLRGSVHATHELNLNLTGLGSIRYRGSPKLTPIVNGIADLARY